METNLPSLDIVDDIAEVMSDDLPSKIEEKKPETIKMDVEEEDDSPFETPTNWREESILYKIQRCYEEEGERSEFLEKNDVYQFMKTSKRGGVVCFHDSDSSRKFNFVCNYKKVNKEIKSFIYQTQRTPGKTHHPKHRRTSRHMV